MSPPAGLNHAQLDRLQAQAIDLTQALSLDSTSVTPVSSLRLALWLLIGLLVCHRPNKVVELGILVVRD